MFAFKFGISVSELLKIYLSVYGLRPSSTYVILPELLTDIICFSV
jgi:hypothetical protein